MKKWFYTKFYSFIRLLAKEVALALIQIEKEGSWIKEHKKEIIKEKAMAAYKNEKITEFECIKRALKNANVR